MTLQQINYVLKVASVGSMNKAAEELYISQPTLTSAIRDVEKEIGIVIFSRNNRGVSLTAVSDQGLCPWTLVAFEKAPQNFNCPAGLALW